MKNFILVPVQVILCQGIPESRIMGVFNKTIKLSVINWFDFIATAHYLVAYMWSKFLNHHKEKFWDTIFFSQSLLICILATSNSISDNKIYTVFDGVIIILGITIFRVNAFYIQLPICHFCLDYKVMSSCIRSN